MADFTKTISASFNLLGGGEPSLWGEMVWGVDDWGEGSKTVALDVSKGITGSVTLADSLNFFFIIGITNSVNLSSDATVLQLKSGDYNYVFPGGGTDANNAIDTEFSTPTLSDASFTAASFATTTWS